MMNGAPPPHVGTDGAAVNGVSNLPKKVIKKQKPAASLFMSTNNRKQARWQNQALKPPTPFAELDPDKVKQRTSSKPLPQQEDVKIPQLANFDKGAILQDQYSGFSDPRVRQPGYPYKDYKLVTTKRELLKSLRYHMMQLVGDDNLDIRNEPDFTRPARLHRRNIMAEMQSPAQVKPEEPQNDLDPDQRVDLINRKEQRAREREANLAQVAPSKDPAKKTNNFKGSQQVFHRTDFTDEAKRLIQTNYEEALPWVLEDYDNKHSFTAQNQLGAFGSHVGFAFETPSGSSTPRCRLVPIEKVYDFKPKPKIYNSMTIEEIVKSLKRGAVDPVWLKEYQHKRSQAVKEEVQFKLEKGLFTGATKNRVDNSIQRRGEDADLDFEDDFADDEEGNLFGDDEDEDERDAKKRIKEEQLQANFLDYRDQAEDEADEVVDQRQAAVRKKLGKSIRKALQKREGNYNHGSDSDSISSSDSDEEERLRLEQEKLKNAKKDEDGPDGKKSAMSSGANTPSGRKEKHGSGREDGSRKGKKRPGSPNLSDASGTDASVARKKKHKSHHPLSSQATPGPSRPQSPDNLDPNSAANRQSRASFTSNPAGSDTDAGAMSDGTRSGIKLKLTAKQRDPGLSPPTSRAGSPAPRSSSTGPPAALPTPEEIARLIPAEGIAYGKLLNLFPALKAAFKDLKDPVRRAEVTKRVREAGQTSAGRIYPFGIVIPTATAATAPGATPSAEAAATGHGS